MWANQAVTGVNIMSPAVVYPGRYMICTVLDASMTNSGVAPPLPWPEPSTRGSESNNNLDRGYVRVLVIRMQSNAQYLQYKISKLRRKTRPGARTALVLETLVGTTHRLS